MQVAKEAFGINMQEDQAEKTGISQVDKAGIHMQKDQADKAVLSFKIGVLIKYLIILTVILFILSVGLNIYYYTYHDLKYVSAMFNVDKENNIPTWFSTIFLVTASLLFFWISTVKKKEADNYSMHWVILAAVFLIMGIDESCQLHEQTSQLFTNYIKGLHFAWLIPGVIFSLGFIAAYIKFFFSLETRWKKLFFISAALYLMGVIGMEIVGNFYQNIYGQENLGYIFVTTIEEGFEFSGLLTLLYSQLSYLKHLNPSYRLELHT